LYSSTASSSKATSAARAWLTGGGDSVGVFEGASNSVNKPEGISEIAEEAASSSGLEGAGVAGAGEGVDWDIVS
jgi:hypothetical protein